MDLKSPLNPSIQVDLDLDTEQSIKSFTVIDTNNQFQTIFTLAYLVREYGTFIHKDQSKLYDQHYYRLYIKYLGHILPIIYSFDDTCKFLCMEYGSPEARSLIDSPSNCNLCISMTTTDDPIIKWIKANENVPTYTNDNINLGRGEYLMNFAHCFLKFIGYKRIRLDDDSYLVINRETDLGDKDSTELKLKLWLYLILTKGCSWYRKFGYVPSNVSPLEYQLAIKKIQSIKLNEVILANKNLEIFIDDPTQTLTIYIQTHSLEQNAVFLNELFQSKYKSYFWYAIYEKMFIANICQTNDELQFVRIANQ
jgi:hypothetical protein